MNKINVPSFLKGEIYLSKTIALAGTLDSKGKEFLYIKDVIESLGFSTLTINTGVFTAEFEPDISNAEVAKAAGREIDELAAKQDRAEATEVLAAGMKTLLPTLYEALCRMWWCFSTHSFLVIRGQAKATDLIA